MDKETVIALARKADVPGPTVWDDELIAEVLAPHLERFAALVAAHEREACAKVCDEYNDGRYANAADLCAAAIRSRT